MYPHKKDDFPRPAVILSDRAQVFLQGALRVFNNESYGEFLTRAYRMVTKKALPDDLLKTNIHACLAHFMVVSKNRLSWIFLPSFSFIGYQKAEQSIPARRTPGNWDVVDSAFG